MARDADISERHLAQLELGEGNISILLLRRIAVALDVSLLDLLAQESMVADRRTRIALVGLRGAGKTTLGSRLATAIGVPFVELDHEIEKDTGMPLAEIFSLYGQPGYRHIERRVLGCVLRRSGRAVISIAGGIVTEPEAYDDLLANCYTIWVKARPEEHMSRVIAQGDLRPMSSVNGEAMAELKRILDSRESQYRRADAMLDTSGDTVERSLEKLQRLLEV
jgi:XRE family aerobic/anaerobic benzoate catabolism transcriptional regulator